MAQSVERRLGKAEVGGSSPLDSLNLKSIRRVYLLIAFLYLKVPGVKWFILKIAFSGGIGYYFRFIKWFVLMRKICYHLCMAKSEDCFVYQRGKNK